MKHIDHLRIPRGSEASVVVAIPVSLDEEDVVVAVRTYGIGDASIERSQECAAWKVPCWLVDQIISGDPWLVPVTLGNPLPDAHGFVLVRDAVPKRGTGVIVVADRIVALTSGGGMQIDDGIDARRRAPGDDIVQQEKSLLVPFVGRVAVDEVFVMQRQAHGVETPALDLADVSLGDVIGQPGVVECLQIRRANEGGQLLFPIVLGGGLFGGVHQVALHDHPIAEIDRIEDDFLIVRTVDDPGAVDLQQLPAGHAGKQGKEKGQQGR